ncbi:MAG TPA: hypothetical protein VL326_30485 [Kofleriaceae bacterium]|nr:hypothetical protein [Kofleriaceae bacterium]
MRIRILVGLLVAIAACDKGSACPSVTELLHGSGSSADRRDTEIVVARCRADHWSADVINCLRSASTYEAQEPCFKTLSKAQQDKLEQAFEPIEREYAEKDRAEIRAKDEEFGRLLAEQRANELAARAPACQTFLDAITDVRKRILGCASVEVLALEQFGIFEAVRADLKELATIDSAAQLASTCEAKAKSLADEKPCER